MATGQLYTSSAGVSSVSGTLLGLGSLQAAISAAAVSTATIHAMGQLAGSAAGVAAVLATLLGTGALQGQTDGAASVSATSQLRWLHEKLERNSYITSVFSATSTITTTSSGLSEIRALTEAWNSIIKDDDE